MGRPSKFTPDAKKRILEALEAGATVKAACGWVPIHPDTYHNWIKRGKEEAERRDKNGIKEGTKQWNEEQSYFEFFRNATRAQQTGMVNAAVQFRSGMNPSQSVSETTVTTTETRIRTVRHGDGRVEDVPYEHVKSEKRQTVTHNPGDWRAAMEYLARRDPENWARMKLELAGKVDTGIGTLLEAIRNAKSDGGPTD